jgi:hypothetical protein
MGIARHPNPFFFIEVMVSGTFSEWSGFSSGRNHTQGEFPRAFGEIPVGASAIERVGFIEANPMMMADRQSMKRAKSFDDGMDFLLGKANMQRNPV